MVPPEDPQKGGVFDVQQRRAGQGRDGSEYSAMVMRRARGFTYLAVLFIVAILMARPGAARRDVGDLGAAREGSGAALHRPPVPPAIGLYFDSTPGGVKRYPRTLEDLVKDPRQPATQRYLRRLYPDPITGKNEWGLVKAPDGGIAGRATACPKQAPLKIAGFRVRDAGFEGAQKYADWKFNHAQTTAAAAGKAPAKAAAKPPGD